MLVRLADVFVALVILPGGNIKPGMQTKSQQTVFADIVPHRWLPVPLCLTHSCPLLDKGQRGGPGLRNQPFDDWCSLKSKESQDRGPRCWKGMPFPKQGMLRGWNVLIDVTRRLDDNRRLGLNGYIL